MANKLSAKQRIKYRIRKKVRGTADRPRLAVYRSNKAIYCQAIDDTTGVTLASTSSKADGIETGTKIDQAKAVGKNMGEKLKALNINTLVFDRAGYLYHGRVKALADGIREEGVKF